MTIKNKILLSYVMLLIVPLSAITLIYYVKSKNIIEEKSIEQFHTVSELANQQFDQYFTDIENLSMNVLKSTTVQKHLREPLAPYGEWTQEDFQREIEMKRFLRGIYELKPGISSIILYGYNGQNYYYHPINRWDNGYDGWRESWVRETVEKEGAWVLSGKREEKQLYPQYNFPPEQVVTFSRLIKDLKSFSPLGVLAINVDISTLEQLAGVNTGDNQLIIYDQKGRLVVSSEGLNKDVQEGELLQVSETSPFTNWTSTYYASKEDLIKESKQMRNVAIVVTVALFLMASLLAHFIASGIVKPLRQLRINMKAVEKGEFSLKIDPAVRKNDEVGQLTQSFHQMVAQIDSLVEAIRKQEKQKRMTELSALQARINPHFMYNTLNGMRWVAMMEGNQRLADLITSFVYLLKFSAKNQDDWITLEKELQLLKYYVALMKMRHEQFDIRLEVEEGMEEHLVVPFLLQPIVENAIFHGLIPANRKGWIDVRMYTRDGKNEAVIRDNGVGMSEEKVEALFSPLGKVTREDQLNKIGLRNVHDRLRLQFGTETHLTVESTPGEGTVVYVIWPIVVKEKEGRKDEEYFIS